MNDNFYNQKEKLVSLSHEINLLRQQVNYLLRNEKPLELLDLDVLMNRTHTIYDTLCAINLGENTEDDNLELDPEAIAGLFGVDLKEEESEDPLQEEPIENQNDEPLVPESAEERIEELTETIPAELPDDLMEVAEIPTEEQTEISEDPMENWAEAPAEAQEMANEEQLEASTEELSQPVFQPEAPIPSEPEVFGFQVFDNQEVETLEPEPPQIETIDNPVEEAKPAGDEYGFLFRFEDVSQSEDFETEKSETLGDRMLQEDHSLAAKLQQNPVRDLRSVIGINDKFLFVNELFGGSMEKYNKSIDNLNDLKTLNGAMIYLNELKIELQWNSSNEAYRKISELVRRKFE